ncbi:hypothetical protein ACE3MQ_25185 [Paenibacillus lentus]|uniref:hypothetical protein n=1 Tax=Paenibacillus lentus TaxID=1338368 RepID=UPI0036471048
MVNPVVPFVSVEDDTELIWAPDEPTLFDAIVIVHCNLNDLYAVHFEKLPPLTAGEKLVLEKIKRIEQIRLELRNLSKQMVSLYGTRSDLVQLTRQRYYELLAELESIQGRRTPDFQPISNTGAYSEPLRAIVKSDAKCGCWTCNEPIEKGQKVVRYGEDIYCNYKCLSESIASKEESWIQA